MIRSVRRAAIFMVLPGLMTLAMTTSGCAALGFGTATLKEDAARSSDLKHAAVAYIEGLCKLPRQQREVSVLELNEALLPNHVSVFCGPGGGL